MYAFIFLGCLTNLLAELNILIRFDQVSVDIDNKKADPTLRKYENPGATVIQMLLAAKEGDVVFLKRYIILIL